MSRIIMLMDCIGHDGGMSSSPGFDCMADGSIFA